MGTEGETPTNVVQGTCQTMCPISEMKLREKERLLHPFEMLKYSTNPSRSVRPAADPERAVKAFSRPAAGRVQPSPQDIRPGPVLLKTVVYLLENVAPITDREWPQVYDFVFDRLRAVRQDAVLQALHGPLLVSILEHIVRFHVYAGYRLCDAPADQFDPVINDQHLLECLKQLIRLYGNTPDHHGNQSVFEALYLLHNLGRTESVLHGLALSESIRESKIVREALELNLAFLQGNFVRFFRRCLQIPSPLCLCAVHRHFTAVRIHALRVMNVAYSSKTCRFPVAQLVSWLHSDRGQLVQLLHACGLLSDQEVVTAQHVNFLKTKFITPDKVEPYKQPEIEAQLQRLGLTSLLLGKDDDPS